MDKRIENHIIQQYYDNQSLYRSLKHDITDIIENIITKNNIKISNFAIRIKTEDALRRKICLKHKYRDVNDITDIVACRIITLFESDIDVIYKLIKQNFDIVEYNDKRKKNYDDRIDFGYNSLHLLVKYNEARLNMIEYSDYRHIIFEIQIRTILQHSWAEVEHGLGYKSQYEIPKDIRRRLTRLSATLEILDEEFVNIRDDIEEYNRGIDHIEKVLKTDLNYNSLMTYYHDSPNMSELTQIICEQFNVSIKEEPYIISELRVVKRFHNLGYMYVHELDEFIIENRDNIVNFAQSKLRFLEKNKYFNPYDIFVWVSLIMLLNQGVDDPENIISNEMFSIPNKNEIDKGIN